ncbi:MAG: MFS transporter [Vicinamibacterales bacterium]
MPPADRLFTPRFVVMCGFNFLVFLSAFQLLPTAPFRIRALGGSAAAAGLFLGFLTYASAMSGPVTGGIADRVGKRRVLMTSSLAIAAFSAVYAVLPSYLPMLLLVVVHGLFWSGLLVAASSYVTDLVPPLRRAEGMSYWGMSTIFAIAVAPTIGLWVFEHGGWTVLCVEAAGLNLLMFAIAVGLLPPDAAAADRHPVRAWSWRGLVEWRVLILAVTLFLYSFGYGGITSFVAMYSEASGVSPRALYFTVFSLAILFTRPYVARLGDRIGHRRVLLPCLGLVMAGFVLLAIGGSRPVFVVSALVFGTGFGSAYPLFLGHIMRHVDPARRGAAFGSILAAFDTGIGTGSVVIGWIVQHYGYQAAYLAAAALAALAVPYFLAVEPRVLPTDAPAHA